MKGWQEGLLEGELKGRQKGLREGRQEGEAASLRRLLQRRFGPLPAALEERIAAADIEQIEAWLDVLLDAPSLEDIFGPLAH